MATFCPENSTLDPAPRWYHETSAQVLDTHTRDSKNEARTPSKRMVFENVCRTDFVGYQEKTVLTTSTAQRNEFSAISPSIQEHGAGSSERRSPAIGNTGSPQMIPEKYRNTETLSDREAHQNRYKKQSLSRVDELLAESHIESSTASKTQEMVARDNRSRWAAHIKISLATSSRDAFTLMKWLSGVFNPTDLESSSQEPKVITLQRIEFHHIGVLQGLRDGNWKFIKENGTVVYRLLKEVRDAEISASNGGYDEPSYSNRPKNIRLINKFWRIFRYFVVSTQKRQKHFQNSDFGEDIMRFSTKYPGAALLRVTYGFVKTVVLAELGAIDEAKKACTNLFDDVDILGTFEKVFSSQIRIVAYLLMTGILRKDGKHVEARFYTAKVRCVSDIKTMVWYLWAVDVLDNILDLRI